MWAPGDNLKNSHWVIFCVKIPNWKQPPNLYRKWTKHFWIFTASDANSSEKEESTATCVDGGGRVTELQKNARDELMSHVSSYTDLKKRCLRVHMYKETSMIQVKSRAMITSGRRLGVTGLGALRARVQSWSHCGEIQLLACTLGTLRSDCVYPLCIYHLSIHVFLSQWGAVHKNA